MEDRCRKFDDTEVAGADLLVLFAGSTSKATIDGAEMRIVWAFVTSSDALVIPIA
jgi:hypothetical protein